MTQLSDERLKVSRGERRNPHVTTLYRIGAGLIALGVIGYAFLVAVTSNWAGLTLPAMFVVTTGVVIISAGVTVRAIRYQPGTDS